ncbi:vitamin K epoxide reductase family protein [Thermoleophilia bacterium SCSIO 60948]|nr:vitamin K epoxide reductase family protein [Thermoleophilia bacterium SCSIO 60948]
MAGERRARILIAVLALVGVAISTYITIAEAGGGAPACVAGSKGCETVAASPYSELAGVNVAVIGIAGYLLIAGCAALPGDLGRFGGFAAALIGFGFSVYLTYLELFEIEAICQWCIASAVVMTLLTVWTGLRAFRFGGA